MTEKITLLQALKESIGKWKSSSERSPEHTLAGIELFLQTATHEFDASPETWRAIQATALNAFLQGLNVDGVSFESGEIIRTGEENKIDLTLTTLSALDEYAATLAARNGLEWTPFFREE